MIGSFKERARGFSCQNNLKGLGAGVSAYMTDHANSWPQISAPDPTAAGADPDAGNASPSAAFATRWIEALAPYGISERTWRCPSIEARISYRSGSNGLKVKRLDYVPTSFDPTPGSAYQWPGHPWFIESGPTHGSGPNLLLTNGRVLSMDQLVKEIR